MIQQAMILAAGFGKRMLPLTEKTPKPLLHFHGRPIIDYSVEKLVKYGVKRIVVNGFHLKEQIRTFLAHKQEEHPSVEFIFSDEAEILETGGGVQKALPLFNGQPFFVVNGDSFWTENSESIFTTLEKAYTATGHTTLSLCPMERIFCSVARGDYHLHPDSRITRQADHKPFAYMGVHITSPDIFPLTPTRNYFSLVEIWDKLETENKLHGTIFQENWYHLSEPGDLVAQVIE